MIRPETRTRRLCLLGPLAFVVACGRPAVDQKRETADAVEHYFQVVDMPRLEPQVLGLIVDDLAEEAAGDKSVDPRLVPALRARLVWDSLASAMDTLHRALLTDAELREAAAFFETPLGQRFLPVLPEVMRIYAHTDWPPALANRRLDQALASFSEPERAEIEAVAGGEFLRKSGLAFLGAYVRTATAAGREQGRS